MIEEAKDYLAEVAKSYGVDLLTQRSWPAIMMVYIYKVKSIKN